jgi:hypothetical protein
MARFAHGKVCSPDRIRTGATALRGSRRWLTRCPPDVQIHYLPAVPVGAAGTHRAQRTPNGVVELRRHEPLTPLVGI